MIGKYEIEICNNRVHYFLTVRRNITILQGNSATGKTELIRLIGEYEQNAFILYTESERKRIEYALNRGNGIFQCWL